MTSIYEIFMMFTLYAFIGWVFEVIYATFVHRRFVNRGFLNGPVCPIYGFGVLLVVSAMAPLKDSLLLLFIGSTILTSALEFVTGFVLEKIFRQKWWDYTNDPLNLMGYVSLPYSLLWGVGCVLVVDFAHPFLYRVMMALPHSIGVGLAWVIALIWAADLVITGINAAKFRRGIRLVEEITGELQKLSTLVGENLSDLTMKALDKGDEYKAALYEKLGDKKTDFETLRDKIAALTEKKADISGSRFFNAFPNLRKINGIDIKERIEAIKNNISQKK